MWAVRECGGANFGDARLTQRLVCLVTKLAEHPESSLPQALGEWSATKAAYRFLDNEKVTVEAIYQAHREATLKRIKDHLVILAVQDTTVFNFTLHRKTEGLGPIGQAGLSGFFLHSRLAVSAQGIPLGIFPERSGHTVFGLSLQPWPSYLLMRAWADLRILAKRSSFPLRPRCVIISNERTWGKRKRHQLQRSRPQGRGWIDPDARGLEWREHV